MSHRVAVVGGDGIGPEVIAEALKVVAAAGVALETTDFDLGGARYLRDGEILSDETLDELRGHDAILLGAVGTPDVPPGVIERGLLLKMRISYLVWAASLILMYLCSNSLEAIPRYLSVVFPLFIVLALVTTRYSPAYIPVLGSSVALLALCTVLLASGYWMT